jgi:KUP system potassium uptake protein
MSAPPVSASRASIVPKTIHSARPVSADSARVGLTVAALGVVFGDLGTSPLYTLQECLFGPHGVQPSNANIMGVLSLIFWSLMMVITLKYLLFLMRADNGGEGGIMALLALAPERFRTAMPGRIGLLPLLVIAGAALLFGDGIITPSVSVLSAVEGLGVATHELQPFVLPLTIAILIALFAVQSRGTAKLASFFGPVMVLWFVTLAVLGGYHLVHAPRILAALSPSYAIDFFVEHGLGGTTILGGVILCVTGGEALYADMGHFGVAPIRNAWLYICTPSLVLNYFGQGALIIAEQDPAARLTLAARPFYAMCPQGVWLYPFVAIATLATIIASQALISGVFSLTYQAVQLGFFPRVTVQHTSRDTEGQIYLPLMNWGLAGACVALVLMFRESSKLAAVYGLAVSGTMAITSVVYFAVVRYTWRWPLWKALAVVGLFLAFDLPFLFANSLKFFEGGYVPVVVGALFVLLMINWRIGRGVLKAYLQGRAIPLSGFIDSLDRRVKTRCPGTAVFLAALHDNVPPALRRLVERVHTLHETAVLLNVVVEHVPRVDGAERVQNAVSLGQGFYCLTLRYGFIEEPDVPSDLSVVLPELGIDTPQSELSYIVDRETFEATNAGHMGRISEGLFSFLSRNAKSATDYFRLPPAQVLEVGARIDL